MRTGRLLGKAILAGVFLSAIGGCNDDATSGSSDAGPGPGHVDATPSDDASALPNDAGADTGAAVPGADTGAVPGADTGAVPSDDGGAVPALTAGQVYCVVSYSNVSADFNGPVDTFGTDVVNNFGAPSVAQAGPGHDNLSIVGNSYAGGFARDGQERGFDVSAGAGVGTVGAPVSSHCTNVWYAPSSQAAILYTWIADRTMIPASSCTVTLTSVQGTLYVYDIVANLVPDTVGEGIIPGVGTATAHATCTADLP